MDKNLEENILKLIKDNLTIPEISKILDVSHSTIRNASVKFNIKTKRADRKFFTTEEIDFIKKSKIDGLSIGAICIKLKRSRASIKELCRKEKIGLDFATEKSRPWTEDEYSDLIKYLKNGDLYRDIAKKMKRGTYSISAKAKEIGYQSDTSTKLEYAKELNSKNLAKCRECNIVADLSLFYKRHKSVCKECHKKKCKETKLKNNDGSLVNILNKRLNDSKYRSIKYTMEFDLDIDFLQKLYNDQIGRCYYSGEKLSFIFGDVNVLSIDRIDSGKGYIKSNIVLCTSILNTMKNSLDIEPFKELITKVFNNLNNIKFSDKN